MHIQTMGLSLEEINAQFGDSVELNLQDALAKEIADKEEKAV